MNHVAAAANPFEEFGNCRTDHVIEIDAVESIDMKVSKA